MTPNPLKEGSVMENSAGLGTVTRKMVRERAVELAVIDGRSAQQVAKSDWDQAKAELTDQPGASQKELALESATEAERWDPLPGSTGRKIPATASEDEDEEGQSDNTRLTEDGMAEAEHDHLRQSAQEAAGDEP